MTYAILSGFGAAPTATAEERQAIIAANSAKTEAYRLASAKWQARRTQYEKDLVSYQAKVSQQEAAYQAAVRAYDAALVAARGQAAGQAQAYASAMASYGAAHRARENLIAQNEANARRVLGTNPLPPGFAVAGFCVTQAQHDQWVWACAPVRGLGAADPVCVWQNLAVCSVPPIPMQPTAPPPVSMPTPPKRPLAPKVPSDPGPAPVSPKLALVPALTPPPKPELPVPPLPPPLITSRPVLEPPPLPPPKQQNLAVWGILALVVVAGGAGGAYWYSKRKKAA